MPCNFMPDMAGCIPNITTAKEVVIRVARYPRYPAVPNHNGSYYTRISTRRYYRGLLYYRCRLPLRSGRLNSPLGFSLRATKIHRARPRRVEWASRIWSVHPMASTLTGSVYKAARLASITPHVRQCLLADLIEAFIHVAYNCTLSSNRSTLAIA